VISQQYFPTKAPPIRQTKAQLETYYWKFFEVDHVQPTNSSNKPHHDKLIKIKKQFQQQKEELKKQMRKLVEDYKKKNKSSRSLEKKLMSLQKRNLLGFMKMSNMKKMILKTIQKKLSRMKKRKKNQHNSK